MYVEICSMCSIRYCKQQKNKTIIRKILSDFFGSEVIAVLPQPASTLPTAADNVTHRYSWLAHDGTLLIACQVIVYLVAGHAYLRGSTSRPAS